MVKPQFEVGRDRLGAGGVVREAALRVAALTEVTAAARALGLRLLGAVASPLPGPSGNVEYFLRLSRGGSDVGDDVLAAAVEAGGRKPAGRVEAGGRKPAEPAGRVEAAP